MTAWTEHSAGDRVQVKPEHKSCWWSGTVTQGLGSSIFEDEHPSVRVRMDDCGKEETYWLDKDEVQAHPASDS